jgi:5-formyltetrahydrofolate cyclo-ligase
MGKPSTRKKIQEILQNMSSEDIQKKSALISRSLFQTEWWNEANIVLGFCSIEGEVETEEIIKTAIAEAKMVVVPRVQGKALIFHQIRDLDNEEDFVLSDWGIKEPCEFLPVLDPSGIPHHTCLIVTPGLAFGRKKHRLGRGGGFYDRFLSQIRQCDRLNIFAIGVCFSEQLLQHIPTGDHDQPVDGVITEEEIIY